MTSWRHFSRDPRDQKSAKMSSDERTEEPMGEDFHTESDTEMAEEEADDIVELTEEQLSIVSGAYQVW